MSIADLFYLVKPAIPRIVQIAMRRAFARLNFRFYRNVWPIDHGAGRPPIGWKGWPKGKRFALVLSHDVDTIHGYNNVLKVAELEERMDFRSCFNFVPERYGSISLDLLDQLRRRGFDAGVHGLKHDGKLFLSRRHFDRQAPRINAYLEKWQTGGFTSPSMQRNLEWMTSLNIDYSTSTFDTDPFEPQPDGVRTIFPFVVHRNPAGLPISEALVPVAPTSDSPSSVICPLSSGLASQPSSLLASQQRSCYVELPYTLPQDSTLFVILQEKTIDIWKRKLDWIAEKGGMALLNTHPDYMNCRKDKFGREEYPMRFYEDFLHYVKGRYRGQYWHGLPREVAEFWKQNVSGQASP